MPVTIKFCGVICSMHFYYFSFASHHSFALIKKGCCLKSIVDNNALYPLSETNLDLCLALLPNLEISSRNPLNHYFLPYYLSNSGTPLIFSLERVSSFQISNLETSSHSSSGIKKATLYLARVIAT